jgi:glycosyltransferase involved in cell wall biosynthesis
MNSPRKILIATPLYPPEIGGPATYSKLLFDELPKYGIDVSVLSFGEVKNLPKGISHFAYFFKLLKKARSVDVIFAQDTVSVGFPALCVSKVLGKKFFVRVPGDHAWEQSVQRYGVKDTIDEFQRKKYGFRVEFLRRVEKSTVSGADKVIVPSMYFKRLVSQWTKNPEKVFCIYNGVDLSDIPEKKGSYVPKTIISAGRLVPWKGFKVLIEILNFLPGWKLFIAGSGPDREELVRFAEKEGVSDRVVFLGQIERRELMERIQDCEVFVLNTSFESFSFQVVEALASGTPVISTNIGNLTEIIDTGVNGILVTPDDKQSLIGNILKLSADSVLRTAISENARQKAKIFSIENTINGLLAELEGIK